MKQRPHPPEMVNATKVQWRVAMAMLQKTSFVSLLRVF